MIDFKKHSDCEYASRAVIGLIDICNLNIYLRENGLHDKYFTEMNTRDDHLAYLCRLELLMANSKN